MYGFDAPNPPPGPDNIPGFGKVAATGQTGPMLGLATPMVNPPSKLHAFAPRSAASLFLLAAACTGLGGCNAESGLFRTAGGPETAIIVSVRDWATKRPIADALVAAETQSRNHPFSVASIMWKTMDSASTGRTDDAGSVRLKVLADRHYRLRIWPRGGAPVVFFHAEPSPLPMGEWMSAELPPGSDPGVEARIDSAN